MAQYRCRLSQRGEFFVKSIISTLAAASLLIGAPLILVGCGESIEEPAADNPAHSTPVPDGMVRGIVVETMDSGGYTYVLLETTDEQRWVAGPRTAVQVGDIIQTGQGTPMKDFASNTLNRSFDVVYFVSVIGNLSNPTVPADHPTLPSDDATTDTAPSDLAVAPVGSGQDIAWLYANKDSLAGQQVSLRGKVVKYNANILGWNFIHIQDGSGDVADGSNDLTVTSHDEAAVGDTIVVTGAIILDKDFGAGYSFPVLMEDASITTE